MKLFYVIALCLLVCGCEKSKQTIPQVDLKNPKVAPTFTLCWSEYPAWSLFGVLEKNGEIKSAKGELGPLETKWNVDIELKQMDYDPSVAAYGSNAVDAVCITNIDVLNPSLSRKSVAILPTSTSVGADALIVSKDIKSLTDLKGLKIRGLEKSVSQYMFAQNLNALGFEEKDYNYVNQDPGAAAQAFQTGSDDYHAIVVWNPFLLQTLKTKPESHVLFDSSTIPNEIVDMVVVGDDALRKEGGANFACAIIDGYYSINKALKNPKTRDTTLVAVGEKFSNLNAEEMALCFKQTKTYDTPQVGIDVYESPEFVGVMKKVIKFAEDHDMVPPGSKPQLTFDASYMKKVADAEEQNQ